MTARLAIGSVSTLALGALLFGSASYWMHRGTAQATPWGAISTPVVGTSGEASSQDDKAKLLRLAALKSGAEAAPASAPAPAASEPVAPVQPMALVDPAPAAIVPEPAPAAVDPTPAKAASDQQVALVEDATPAPDGAAKSGLININTASASVLDHLPGAGRIGHTIVSHRPYRSVKDLINKRVLRLSDFQKIQSRVSVD
ncbi:helix-hairpin-helix domain-containing protein [Lichenihabitans sp. Uapishka_5]|uniref:helix-hairpin-helix domain-containing protein n=1 Tax=Lichenihabitans sp. Uapishka_5 TaxID=3037302 RepID=UPI0029E813E4|nr:helix-hairpin-helix domain-containing protein [Lichenihabitans sp. Uapishka_5]MDX7950061.1 helix-hairpin-helix domain-containing protein [Lichenihabitans sp. Uapishka_5]